jgi:hypothetical protein
MPPERLDRNCASRCRDATMAEKAGFQESFIREEGEEGLLFL